MPGWVIADQVKADLAVEDADTRDDEQLQVMVDAAVAFVERVHAGRYRFGIEGESPDLPEPGADLVLGTVRLARRWYERRRSPDGLVSMGELGAARIPSIDPDIERLLRIGRFRDPVFA